MNKSDNFSIRLSPDGMKTITRVIKEQSRPGMRINRNQAIEIALAIYAGKLRCPECTALLEPILLEEDSGETGFWRCPDCTLGDTFVINPVRRGVEPAPRQLLEAIGTGQAGVFNAEDSTLELAPRLRTMAEQADTEDDFDLAALLASVATALEMARKLADADEVGGK